MIEKIQALWHYRPEPGRVDRVMATLWVVEIGLVLCLVLAVAMFFYIATAGPDRVAYIISLFN